MRKRSYIDDVRITKRHRESESGSPILFSNPEIRKMFKLAKAGKNDVIFDLGCGWAQNLIIAVTELYVKKCYGIECIKSRCKEAKDRVNGKSISNQITIIQGYFQDLIEGKFKEVKIEDATIVIYALETEEGVVDQLSKKLQEGCRLVYYYNGLIPEIKSDAIDHPFYVSTFPFKRPSSELDWLRSVVKKGKSSLIEGKKPSAKELWDELYHDYNVDGLKRSDVRDYQKRLKQILK